MNKIHSEFRQTGSLGAPAAEAAEALLHLLDIHRTGSRKCRELPEHAEPLPQIGAAVPGCSGEHRASQTRSTATAWASIRISSKEAKSKGVLSLLFKAVICINCTKSTGGEGERDHLASKQLSPFQCKLNDMLKGNCSLHMYRKRTLNQTANN